jgi:hypothetical protein
LHAIADGAENRRLAVGAQRDSRTADHQIESFSGTESGTEIFTKDQPEVVKSIAMIW